MRVSAIRELECCLCLDEKPTQILRPCNHQCLCEPCYRVIATTKPFCPLCRAKIESVGINGQVEPIAQDVWVTFQARREEYFAKAKPIISWVDNKISFEFDIVSGFHPTKFIMDDLIKELGFTQGNRTKTSIYGKNMHFTKNGVVDERGPGISYETTLFGDVKINEIEMIAWVKNCAFHHYNQHLGY